MLEIDATDTETNGDTFRLIMRLVADLGGIALVLYSLCWVLVRLCTENQLENYLVSELFKSDGAKRERKSSVLTSTFYNEILHSDEEVVGDSVGQNEQTKLQLKNGRALCAQELNITKFVATNRASRIFKSMVDKRTLQKLV